MNMKRLNKVIALLLVFNYQVIALSDDGQLAKCNNTLRACSALVDAQDESITALKKQVKAQQDALASQEDRLTDGIPWWVFMLTGAVAGGIVVHELNK